MKQSLKPGLIATKRFDIDLPRTIDFLGEELRIYATPELVRDVYGADVNVLANPTSGAPLIAVDSPRERP